MPAKPPAQPAGTKSKVLLVDDHATLREAIAEVINHQPDLAVCAEATTAASGLQAVAAHKPDVAVIDVSLAGRNGIELIKDIHYQNPKVRVLVLSMHDEAVYGVRALAAGAQGYIRKEESIKKVLAAIRQVLRGETYMSEPLTKLMAQQAIHGATPTTLSPATRLSDRELEVFELIGRGQRTHQIAKQLHLSERTVEAYRANIREKLNLGSATELLQQAIQWTQSPDR